jgi:hypothetical protein
MSKYEIRSRQDKSTALEPDICYDITLEDIEATQRAWLMYKRLYYVGEAHGMMMGALVPQPFRLPGSTHKTLL